MKKNISELPPFEEYIKTLKACSKDQNEKRFVAKQLLQIHYEVSKRKSPIILELGVDRGQSTKVILNAICAKSSAHLVSVDIRDCSKVSSLDYWTFIKNDSTKIKEILKSAPMLESGIDIIYIDSLHTQKHVYKEIYGWFPFLKKNGVIFFDDIDSGPYLIGQRKDSVGTEIANRNIYELIEAIFISNMNIIDLNYTRGSTGLARIDKICSRKNNLNPPKFIKKRSNLIIWKIINYFFKKNQYRHSLYSNKSFLIDVTKFKK